MDSWPPVSFIHTKGCHPVVQNRAGFKLSTLKSKTTWEYGSTKTILDFTPVGNPTCVYQSYWLYLISLYFTIPDLLPLPLNTEPTRFVSFSTTPSLTGDLNPQLGSLCQTLKQRAC
mmetsp:Transcript_8958/g.16838  ORF Transcript_8958/g.16838 Transcript_8958/m.16838 type:complete len:116 (-) Transcript_8958:2196-2543(-)